MNLVHAKEVFDQFVSQYDQTNNKIHLKLIHTNKVMNHCEYISKHLFLDEINIQLSILIGLLHDIGRFEQLRLYNSFDDSIIPHAQCSLDILFKQNKIRDYIEEDTYDSIIYEAIKQHGCYRLEADLPKQQLLHAKIIRDADKLDNYRVKLEEPIETMLDISEKELGRETISQLIYDTILSHSPIDNSTRKTHMDMWISYIGYVYDINFKPSLQFILKNHFIEKMVDRIPYSNENTKKNMEIICRSVVDYMNAVTNASKQ